MLTNLTICVALLMLLAECRALATPKNRSMRSKSSKLGLLPAFEEEAEGDGSTEVEKQLSRPTLTEFEVHGPTLQSEKPKIVVLGASGRIGR